MHYVTAVYIARKEYALQQSRLPEKGNRYCQ
jgi:hypothetical protein